MHRFRCVLRRRVLENPLTESKSFPRKFTTHRALCSEKTGDSVDNGSVSKASDEGQKDGKSKEAKAKLENLLKSIVQDSQKDAAEKKAAVGTSIDMKLAAPIKERRPVPEKSTETPEEKENKEDLGEEMVAAVKKVAESIGDDPQVVESELVQKLKTQVGKKINLSDIFAGMKIDRGSKSDSPSTGDMELSRAHRVRRLLDERTKTRETKRMVDGSRSPQAPRQRRAPAAVRTSYVPIDLFGSPPLGIFTRKAESSAAVPQSSETSPKMPKLETWDLLAARDLKLSVTHPPANGFEEMILWTEQGKLWKFPIDNEQGLNEEAKVSFHEHVFLEPQIESWCPKKGPIRHFMELVCVGLSKNPFLTVKEKHEQIEWYHEYFKEKASIIKEVGAGEIK